MGRHLFGMLWPVMLPLLVVFTTGCTIDLSISSMGLNSIGNPGPILSGPQGTFPIGKASFNFFIPISYQPTVGGDFILADYYKPNCRIRTVDANFVEKGCFHLAIPQPVFVDSAGNIYAVDSNTDQIKKFDKDGNLLLTFGGFGSADGEFNAAGSVAVDSSGNIYVADRMNHRMQVFDSDGDFLFKFGSLGSGDGQFNGPSSIAFNPDGDLLVVDTNNNRIQKFSPAGVFISKFGTSFVFGGELIAPNLIRVDMTTGDSYVVVGINANVVKYDAAGALVTQISGHATTVADIALVGNELVIVGQSGVTYHSKAGTFLRTVAPTTTEFQDLRTLTMGIENDFYVVDGTAIKHLSYSGQVLHTFGNYPVIAGLDVDSEGQLWAANTSAGTVLKFSADGNLLATYASSGSGAAQLTSPFGIMVVDDVVYVCDTGNNRIQMYSRLTGAHIGSFGETTGPGTMIQPRYITLGDDDHFYITGPSPVLKYDLNGDYVASLGTYNAGASATDFQYAVGIYSDSDGIYVLDSTLSRVTKFDYSGGYVATIGEFGGAPGALFSPFGITGDGLGNIYISEMGNNRIQKFNSLGVVQSE